MIEGKTYEPIPTEVRSFVGSPAVRQILKDRESDALVDYTRFNDPDLKLDIGFYGHAPKPGSRRPLWLVRFPGADDLYAGVCVPRTGETEEGLSGRLTETVRALHKIYPNLPDFDLLVGSPQKVEQMLEQMSMMEFTPHQLRMELVAEYIERERRKKPHEYKQTKVVRGVLGPGDEPDSFLLVDNVSRQRTNPDTNVALSGFTLNNVMIQGAMHNGEEEYGFSKNQRYMRDQPDLIRDELCAGIYIPNYEVLNAQILEEEPTLRGNPELIKKRSEEKAYEISKKAKTYLLHKHSKLDWLSDDYHGGYIAVATDDQIALWQQPFVEEPVLIEQNEINLNFNHGGEEQEQHMVQNIVLPYGREIVAYSRLNFTALQKKWITERAGGMCEVPHMGDTEHNCVGRLNIHHIQPQFWAQIHGVPEDEINAAENALVVCQNYHIGFSGLPAEQGLIHPDHRKAQIVYQGGDINAYHTVGRRHAEMARANIPYWYGYNDAIFQDIAGWNTAQALRATQTVYPIRQRRKKAE